MILLGEKKQMFLKKLFTKWGESVEIFKPQNLKLFVLASLNTFKRSSIILLKNSWWMIPFFIILFLFGLGGAFFVAILEKFKLLSLGTQVGGFLSFLFFALPFIFLTFFIFLFVRPSVETKNFFYFMGYFKKFWAFFILTGFYFYVFNIQGLFSIYSVVILFFLDSKGKLTSLFYSLLNGIKLAIFYLPVFLILGLINMIKIPLISNIPLINKYYMIKLCVFTNFDFIIRFGFIRLFLVLGFSILAEILFLSFLTVYYIKIKHKDFHFFYHK